MTAQTNAQRQRARRARLAQIGVVDASITCHRDDVPVLKAMAQKLMRERRKRNALPHL